MKSNADKIALYGERVEITQEGRYHGQTGVVLDGYNSMNATHDYVYIIDTGAQFLVPMHEKYVRVIK